MLSTDPEHFSTQAFIYAFFCLLGLLVLIHFALTNWRLIQRVKALKLSARQQDLWTAFICHELRSPLFALKMQLSLMKSSNELPASLDVHVDASLEASEQLLGMVSDILDGAQVRSGSFLITPSLTNITEVASSVFNAYKVIAKEKGLCLSFHADPNTPQCVNLDAERLRQVIVNLVSNAIKYTQKGEIKIQIKSSADDVITLSVTDTGLGISKSELNKIFEPFYTSALVSQAETNFGLSSSNGLGLAIVKSIANASGWKIRVLSSTTDTPEQSKGSTFQVLIPINHL